MSDLDMTRLCAQGMGWRVELDRLSPAERYRVFDQNGDAIYGIGSGWVLQIYQPLHDDAQAMALVKKLRMAFAWDVDTNDWWARYWEKGHASWVSTGSQDLNRAIVECVAKMQKAKGE